MMRQQRGVNESTTPMPSTTHPQEVSTVIPPLTHYCSSLCTHTTGICIVLRPPNSIHTPAGVQLIGGPKLFLKLMGVGSPSPHISWSLSSRVWDPL
jgi:hypothetical protein